MTAAATKFPFDDEEFIEVSGFVQYLVSTYGRVYSVRRRKFLKPSTSSGAPRVMLSNEGVAVQLALAPVVLTSFGKKPPRPNSKPSYNDGNVHNCALANLEWV